MGCDIHAHVEIKVNDHWHHWSSPNIPRSYPLFGRMAGVRSNEYEPIALPRGLPDDVSVLTAIDAIEWEGDGHTHSWLTSHEVEQLAKEFDLSDFEGETWGYLFGNPFWDFWRLREYYPKEIQDYRLVFWFDN